MDQFHFSIPLYSLLGHPRANDVYFVRIISLCSINWLVCTTETECVYCAVRVSSFKKTQGCRFKGLWMVYWVGWLKYRAWIIRTISQYSRKTANPKRPSLQLIYFALNQELIVKDTAVPVHANKAVWANGGVTPLISHRHRLQVGSVTRRPLKLLAPKLFFLNFSTPCI